MDNNIYAKPDESYLLSDVQNTENTQNTQNTNDQKDELTVIDEENLIIINNKSQYAIFYFITHIIISFFAIYLSWRCNKYAGFNLIAFICALFCPYLYIIWALAMYGGCGVFESY
jgi:hypothetical protein